MSVRKSIVAYTTAAIVIAVVLIGISTAAIPFSLSSHTTSTLSGIKSQNVSFPVLLTDPPIVPEGTTSLNLTYNRVQIGVLSQNQHQWINVSATGTVNLLNLVNISKTIGLAQIPQGATVEQVKFGVASVVIDVKGVTYNVTTVNNVLTVPISDGANIQQLNLLLLDLTSHVVEIDTGNASTPVFVLIPNAVAVVRPSPSNSKLNEIGTLSNLTTDDLHELDNATGAASILARLSVSAQATSFSVAIENTGNVSLSLQAIRLEGHFNSTASQAMQCVSSESSGSSSATSKEGIAASALTSMEETSTISMTTTETSTTGTTSSNDVSTTMSTSSSETGDHNTTWPTTIVTMSSSSETGESSSTSTSVAFSSTARETTETSSYECEYASVFETRSGLVFISNGTTLVPFLGELDHYSNALVIPPNSTITLTFSGTVTSAGESGQVLTIFPIAGNVYTINAELSNDVSALANVTAT